ncbi:MAG: Uma2 family endonuclease [Acidobacteria bacterium]|jgi:Uma2 family endonuclease|nr:Uma2 family endonuclease [Acidobacteriota bacterium]
MSQNALVELPYDFDEVIENLVTEDDEPVENLISEKQMRLLVEPLYTSWKLLTDEETPQPRSFLAATDVGIFFTPYQSPIVPDMLLSLDIEPRENFFEKKNRSYFVWEFGKVPEVAVEIVSNKKGEEVDGKMNRYAKMAVSYYVVFDPLKELSDEVLCVYELGFGGRRYHLRRDYDLPDVGLGLTLWRGEFEEEEFEWLRWCDADGNLILSGKERAEKAERKLRELGIDPTQI